MVQKQDSALSYQVPDSNKLMNADHDVDLPHACSDSFEAITTVPFYQLDGDKSRGRGVLANICSKIKIRLQAEYHARINKTFSNKKVPNIQEGLSEEANLKGYNALSSLNTKHCPPVEHEQNIAASGFSSISANVLSKSKKLCVTLRETFIDIKEIVQQRINGETFVANDVFSVSDSSSSDLYFQDIMTTTCKQK